MSKYLMGIVGIFIFGTIFACICSGRWLLNGEINIINSLASFSMSNVQTAGGWALPKSPLVFWDAIVTALAWNYPFLNYSWCIFLKIPLWMLSAGFLWGVIEMAITVVQGLLGAIRSFIT